MNKNIPETSEEQEEWRVIPGLIYSGFYEASSFGRIKDKPTGEISTGIRGTYYTYYIHEMKKSQFVHRLVALAFLGQPANDKLVVNHKDLNKHNNRIDNLEYVTQSRNAQHASDHYRNVTPEAIRQRQTEIISLRAAGWAYGDIARQFSMDMDQVRAIVQASGLQTEDNRCEYIYLPKRNFKLYVFSEDFNEEMTYWVDQPRKK